MNSRPLKAPHLPDTVFATIGRLKYNTIEWACPVFLFSVSDTYQITEFYFMHNQMPQMANAITASAEKMPALLITSTAFSAFSMSSLKVFLFSTFNLLNMATLTPKTKPWTRTRISAVRQLYRVNISFAALDTPDLFSSRTLDLRALKHHVFGQIIKLCIRWDFHPRRSSDCITNTISICEKCGRH